MEASNEVITKEAFLKNITVANRHLCLVIDNPSLPSYIQGKVKEAIDLLRADEETAPETSLGIESNILTVNNPGIANSTQTVSYDQQANIDESEANSMHNPDTQEPQSMTGVQIPSQVETSTFLTCSNISHQPTNSNASGDPNNIHSTLMVGPPDSNCTPFNSDSAINPAVTNSASTLIPKVPLPVPVSCPSRFFLQHEDVLIATLGSIYHLKTSSWNITLGSILALDKNRNSRIESVELPNYLPSGIKIKSDYGTSISQWLKHLDNVGLDIFLAKSNEPFFSEDILNTTMLLDFNTPVGHLPKNIHDIVYIMQPISPVKFVPQQVTTENPLSVEYALAGFLASCFSFNKNRGAILPMEGFHVLIAINMVQAHAKCQDNPAGPSSSIRPKRKGKASSSSIETVSSKTLQLVYKEIGLERPLYCLLMAFCAAGVRGLMLGSNNWRNKQHLSLPKKALVNAVISELS
ncbi:hypothetical protein BY996DRAFT_7995660 [Phakopsora pachyrhizi]|nr:hypothetical protein BY996DRAFT_7995660 [Phakopsora pachyrhizi]